jgi:hypothetical protein
MPWNTTTNLNKNNHPDPKGNPKKLQFFFWKNPLKNLLKALKRNPKRNPNKSPKNVLETHFKNNPKKALETNPKKTPKYFNKCPQKP